MSKTFLKQMQEVKFAGRCDGILFGLDLAAVAFNHKHGIGAKRLNEATEEVQSILDEIKSNKDYDRIRADLVNELTRIHGEESREFWLNRYISLTSGV